MLKKDEMPLNVDYKVDYRDVKYPRLEFKTGSLLLVLPKDSDAEAKIIQKHQKWIIKKEEVIKQALKGAEKKTLDITRTVQELKLLVFSTIENYQKEPNLYANDVFFRKMKTKWASYSPRNNLTINTSLKYLPKELIEYVIFHEMVHSIEKKHNKRFWNIIKRKFSNYKTKENALLIYWFLLQKQGLIGVNDVN